jgi:hypothetical protein
MSGPQNYNKEGWEDAKEGFTKLIKKLLLQQNWRRRYKGIQARSALQQEEQRTCLVTHYEGYKKKGELRHYEFRV